MNHLSQVRGQCYDWASNTSGQYSGLQARVNLESPKAFYVHCYAHCLNVELVDATMSNKTARNFLEPSNHFITRTVFHSQEYLSLFI